MIHLHPHSPIHTHELKRTLHTDVLFPDHPKRVESDEHRAVRHELIVERKLGCWICDRSIDDFGGDASALEIHHLFAEYAEFFDIDPELVRAEHPTFATYNEEGDYETADSKCGSLVLCSLHHRGSKAPGRAMEEGIHDSDLDTWMMQRFIKDIALHLYFPDVVVIRKGVSDAQGYLDSFLQAHAEDNLPARNLPAKDDIAA